ncbi:MAG: LuxR C-terminal-related transcriptional regulator [Lautropia sp.]
MSQPTPRPAAGDAIGDDAASAARFDTLVDRTYQAALGEFAWSDLCEEMASAFGWLRVRMLRQERADAPLRVVWASDATGVPSTWAPWVPAPIAARAATGSWKHETCPFGQDLVSAHGMPHDGFVTLGTLTRSMARLGDGTGATFLLQVVREGVAEDVRAEPDTRGLEDVERLRPHLARALALHGEREARLARERMAEALLDAIPQAVAVVAADGTIARSNRAWRRMFAGAPTLAELAALLGFGRKGAPGGGALDASLSELFAPAPAPATAHAVPAATDLPDRPPVESAPPAAIRRRIWRTGKPGSSNDRLIVATAMPATAPVPAGGGDSDGGDGGDSDGRDSGSGAPVLREPEPRVLLIALAPGSVDGIDGSLLADTFGLTRAEAKVAQGLARGDKAREIADTRHVSNQTVRSQMRTIYRKLGVRRQADLVRIIAQLPRVDPGAGDVSARADLPPTAEPPTRGARP